MIQNLIEEEARRNESFYRLRRLGNDNGRRLNAEYPDFAEMRINTHVERTILYLERFSVFSSGITQLGLSKVC